MKPSTTRTQEAVISLRVSDLTKSFGRRRVFDGISLNLETGGSLVVTGRNGSGKSTLLRTLAGLSRADRGLVEIAVDGRALPPEQHRRLIGLVAPDLVLYEELTAGENLDFFAKLRGLPTGARSAELLEYVGLSGREKDAVSSYSSGMKQRLKYAFALLHRPPVLLLDEPSANLDEAGIEIVERVVAEQKARGILVVATNEAEEIRYGDSVLRLGD